MPSDFIRDRRMQTRFCAATLKPHPLYNDEINGYITLTYPHTGKARENSPEGTPGIPFVNRWETLQTAREAAKGWWLDGGYLTYIVRLVGVEMSQESARRRE